MGHGTHEFVEDVRNEGILINVNGALTERAKAVVSVFDSGFMLGDGVWEGMRVHRGKIVFFKSPPYAFVRRGKSNSNGYWNHRTTTHRPLE
jgi:hypothetical protein